MIYRWRGVNVAGTPQSGQFTMSPADLAEHTEKLFGLGWRSLEVQAGPGPVPPSPLADRTTVVARIEKHPETGRRTWWTEADREAGQ